MFYRFLIVTVLFFSSLSALEDIKDLKSFNANFSQIITSPTNTKIIYDGEVFIKNDGKILWKYKTPVIKNVYVFKDYAIVDEPELEQAIYTSLENEINIIKLLNDAKKINDKEYISKIDGINYEIDILNGKISQIKYSDKLDNKVSINFTSVVQNELIDDKLFKFTVPDNYDIIKK